MATSITDDDRALAGVVREFAADQALRAGGRAPVAA
jgi:hypothetical protein